MNNFSSNKTSDARGILSYFTRHNTIANLLLVLMLALGLLATTKIRSQYFPDIVIESVSINVAWPGAGAEDVDTGIIDLLEPVLLSVDGVDRSSSRSTEGSARVSVSFEPGWDMARATEDVKSAVESIQKFPDGVEVPEVIRGAWRDGVTDVVISGPVSLVQLGEFADEFTAKLYREGITHTTIRGISDPIVSVSISAESMFRNDVQLSEVATAIANQTQTNPAGDVAGGASRIRTGIERRSAQEIAEIAIRITPDGDKLLVGDVASIETEGADSGRAYFIGDNQAVLISVNRSDGGDAIAIQATVEKVAADLQAILPQGTTVTLINTRAEQITDRLSILLENGLMGLALVLFMLYLFLGFQTAFWVAAGIPVAMFAAIAVMYIAGLTINMMSLFALIITLGIVVDDAIVVGEHADFRARRLGESPAVAAENAASRMISLVFSSTITTVLAFFGLILIGGRFGALISDIPFTVIAVLVASLAECFLILPNHMRHAITSRAENKWYDAPNRAFDAGFRWLRCTVVRPGMHWVIRLRYPMLAAMILILSSTITMVINRDVTWRFFSSPEQGSVTGNIAMLPGSTRADTIEMVQEVQRAAIVVSDRYEDEFGVAPVLHSLAQVGGTTGRGLLGQGTKDADQLGSIDIGLIDADLRPYSSSEFLAALQNEVQRLPLLETLSFRRFGAGPGGDSIDVSLFGADSTTLKEAAEYLKFTLSRYPEISGLEDSLSYDKTEYLLLLTPLGESLNFTIDALGSELRDRLNGIEAASLPDGIHTSKVIVQLPADEVNADFLNQTLMRTPTGQYVPLSDIVSVESSLGFSMILRENGLRLINISGDVAEDNPEIAAEITETLQTEILPDLAMRFAVEWELGGLAQQEQDFLSDALIGFTLVILGIYLVLCWIFASWTLPIVVLAIIPFGLVGTIWGHYVWSVPMSMFTVIGLIGMTGIIINDSIVLVSTIQEYSEKKGLIPAIIDATTDRLRPLVLTTLTTVVGLAPLLFETSQQAQFLRPTVITLVYGLGFGFFIVLLMVPSLFAVKHDISKLWPSLRRSLLGRRVPKKLRIGLVVTNLLILSLLSVTVGYFVLNGELIGWVNEIAKLIPILPDGASALMIAILGTIAILVIATPILAAVSRRKRQ
ncbi:acriflavine resistance protein B [Rhodobacterales bacterium 52_120_T64]|nr:acriflavine resistance protein B [Rhodobacterales bacterium 52_120_T64]